MTHWRSKKDNEEAIYGWLILGSIVLTLLVLVILSQGKII